MFSFVTLEQRVPKNHPLRAVRNVVARVLGEMSPSIIPQLSYVPQVLGEVHMRSKGNSAWKWAKRVKAQAAGFMSDEHFTVDGNVD